MNAGKWFLGLWLSYLLVALLIWLLTVGYGDLTAGILAVLMAASGIWLSAKGMARLKGSESLSDPQLESAYRYRNAGVALGLTGSGLLVFSWQSFLARFINA